MFILPYRDENPSRHFPVMTALLIALNAVAFLVELQLAAEGRLDAAIQAWAVIPRDVITRFDLDTLLDLFRAMFLHGGWLHLLGNMLYLYIFGDNVEDVLGPGLYFAFYVLSGLIATLTQVFAYPHSPVPTLGASGAIAGVLGAYVVLFPHARIRTLFWFVFVIQTITLPALLVLGVWFIFQFFQGYLAMGSPLAGGGVAYFAHVGGFAAGMALILVLPRRRR